MSWKGRRKQIDLTAYAVCHPALSWGAKAGIQNFRLVSDASGGPSSSWADCMTLGRSPRVARSSVFLLLLQRYSLLHHLLPTVCQP